jgi:gas vesicle protein
MNIMKPVNTFLAGLIAGAAIGGIVALLYAPGSGKETREQLKQKLADLEKEFDALRGTAAEKSDKVRKDLAEKLAAIKREIDSLTGVVS